MKLAEIGVGGDRVEAGGFVDRGKDEEANRHVRVEDRGGGGRRKRTAECAWKPNLIRTDSAGAGQPVRGRLLWVTWACPRF